MLLSILNSSHGFYEKKMAIVNKSMRDVKKQERTKIKMKQTKEIKIKKVPLVVLGAVTTEYGFGICISRDLLCSPVYTPASLRFEAKSLLAVEDLSNVLRF